jgi:DHA2 family multidrug resistance protein-like MFS transporter
LAVAAQLPDGMNEALVVAAREAFVQGMHLTSGIAAVVALGLSVLALVMLRDVPANDESAQQIAEDEAEALDAA